VSANAMLVLGEKYYQGWRATVDGKSSEIYPVDYVLRGVYLTPGKHSVSFLFDPTPFKVGKYLTLGSFAVFAFALLRELLLRRREASGQPATEAKLSQA
ncbi:YfhO family protein, partial [Geomonas sp.]|uniref:YfhO family protein n=1 Tax=Geomonas sp. TaxID=2651584 RepID=UPI002B4A8D40